MMTLVHSNRQSARSKRDALSLFHQRLVDFAGFFVVALLISIPFLEWVVTVTFREPLY